MFSFTCQVFNIMRTAGDEVFKPLVTPLYDYINLVIDSKDCSEDEYECLNMQVSCVLPIIQYNENCGG